MVSFEGIVPLEGTFIDCATQIALFGLAFTSRHDDIKSINFIDLEFMIVDLLIEGFLVDNSLVAVNQMFLQLVRQNTLQGGDFVGFGDFLNGFGGCIINVARFKLS